VAKAGITGLEQYELAIDAMAAVVTKPTAKGAASNAVTKRLPNEMGRDCRPCKARHVSDSAMRTSALAAGLELQPATAPPVLLPRAGATRPSHVDKAAVQKLIDAYLRLLGPATLRDVADYLGARRADLERYWPDDLTEVDVAGTKAFIPPSAADELAHAKPVELVRLVGGFDPFLRARDRDLLVPDKAAQKALWPVLGRPGALLVAGDVAGLWCPKTSAKKLTLNVEAFGSLPSAVWEQVEAEAERVAAYRGAASVSVTRV